MLFEIPLAVLILHTATIAGRDRTTKESGLYLYSCNIVAPRLDSVDGYNDVCVASNCHNRISNTAFKICSNDCASLEGKRVRYIIEIYIIDTDSYDGREKCVILERESATRK